MPEKQINVNKNKKTKILIIFSKQIKKIEKRKYFLKKKKEKKKIKKMMYI